MLLSKDLNSIVLDHGSGGLLSQDLVANIIAPTLGDRYLGKMEDSAVLELEKSTIAMTTDSFVVDPIFFKNGDIGKMAVCGTVNDIAVSGAKPLYLTLGMVIEEGFFMKDLITILNSIRTASQEANVFIVAGDTKVVKKREIDKIFLNTSGIGIFTDGDTQLSYQKIQSNDAVIVTNWLGNHSIHILSLREGLGYETKVASDCAPLNNMIHKVIKVSGSGIHYMRDLTRGGLGSALNEIASAVKKGIRVNLYSLPIQHETKMASDMLGISPIYLANEGCLCIICDPKIADKVIMTLRVHKYGSQAVKVGFITDERPSTVIGINRDGDMQVIDHLYGKELPRLC